MSAPQPWASLSDAAQSVLEHLLGFHDDSPRTLRVEEGSVPTADGRRLGHGVGPVDGPLFSEIAEWVRSNREDFETFESGEGWLRLRLAL